MAHAQQLQFVRLVSEHLAADYSGKRVLEVGSYDVNGSIRQLFRGSSYVGVDLLAGPGVDLVCDGHRLDHADDSYDLTLSCESFEHNPQWRETFLNMHRMTKPGGIVLFTLCHHRTPGTRHRSHVSVEFPRHAERRAELLSKPDGPGLSPRRLHRATFRRALLPHEQAFLRSLLRRFQERVVPRYSTSRDRACRTCAAGKLPNISARGMPGAASESCGRSYWFHCKLPSRLPERYFQNFALPYCKFVHWLLASGGVSGRDSQ